MRRRLRSAIGAAALLAAALSGALATAGPARASYAPRLAVTPTGGAVRITASVGASDDPTARTQIYVPAGYRVNTSEPVGARLGPVAGTASAADLSGAVLQLQGQLQVVAADAAAQAQCGISAVATWDLHLSAATQTIDIPLYVVQTAGAEASAGPYKLVVCLPPPDVPPGTPGRAVLGAKLLSATFTSSAITGPARPGEQRWTSQWLPYVPGQGAPNATGTVEAQALVRTPAGVRISVHRKRLVRTTTVKVRRKHVRRRRITTSVTVLAKVAEAGKPVAGAKVTVQSNGRSVGAATTNRAGLATRTFVLVKGPALVKVTAAIPDRDLGAAGCVATAAFGGAPCVDAILSGSTQVARAAVAAYRR